ncbi:MAG: hypothetical protein AAGA58_03215 [Verrucomicrobiota bacterium]
MPVSLSASQKALRLASLREQAGGLLCTGADLERRQKRSGGCFSTGLEQVDRELGGGVGKGAITEMVAARTGAAGMVASLLGEARSRRIYTALIDVGGTFDPGSYREGTLETLLWVRCRDMDQAVRAVDILARDENFQWLLLDATGRRKVDTVASRHWQRFAHSLRESGSALVVLSPQAMVGSFARQRIQLVSMLGLEAFDVSRRELVRGRAERGGRVAADFNPVRKVG